MLSIGKHPVQDRIDRKSEQKIKCAVTYNIYVYVPIIENASYKSDYPKKIASYKNRETKKQGQIAQNRDRR